MFNLWITRQIRSALSLGGAIGLASIITLGAVVLDVNADNAAPELGTWGVDLTGRDLSIPPGNDFFRHANGTWLSTYEIPEDLSSYSSFTKLRLRSEEQIRVIIEEVAGSGGAKGSIPYQIGGLYNDYLDTEATEAKGLAPVMPLFEEIQNAGTHDQIAYLMAKYKRISGGGFRGSATTPFSFYIGQDKKDPSKYIASFSQSGLGLPSRDYYLKTDNPRFVDAVEAYTEYLEKMFTIAGQTEPADRARKLVAMETKIAQVHWPRADLRNADKTYNKMSRQDLMESASGFPWNIYLETAGLGSEEAFIVAPPSAYTGMAKIFAETPVETWKDFLIARVLRVNAAILPQEVDQTQFEFDARVRSGAKEQRERWKRGVQFVNGAMGEALGQLYVERHFTQSAKDQMDELVTNLLAAMKDRIHHLDWMSEETKKQALDKLAKFTVKIGYPDEWRDYSKLEITPGDLVGNAFRARAFANDYNLSKLGSPVNRLEWFLPPQTVNAYYNPTLNEIVFPAAILQPPFFDPFADKAVNYGGIGAVIGHEIGHGFDDQGRKSDGSGVLRDWWTKEDADRFKERADVLVEQYGAFTPLEDMTINGRLTLGENIGDLGGLEIAYHAYKMSLDGQEAPIIDDLTGDQRFFLGFAQIWRGKMRDEALARRLTSDSHSPPEFRVNGPLPNIDAWYKAFGVKPGDGLYMPQEDRVRIW